MSDGKDFNYSRAINRLTLKDLFDRQADLQKHLTGADLPGNRPDLVSYHALGLIAELGEVLQADKNWKPWNINNPVLPVDFDELRKEVADCWLFLINLSLVLNLSYLDVAVAYDDKFKEVAAKRGLMWDGEKLIEIGEQHADNNS